MAALKITTSIERIGDFAVDIAKTTARVEQADVMAAIDSFTIMIDNDCLS
ncbi:hypothetical protein GCM10010965_12160 [Caldalkalibacillus thermarum]|nr:hypothetical protein [Caldalkalibacillus thermarum]GGK20640.1 hypothetical protein GCM10010965_12160 [Caldalkalibacillus thermarum]